VQGTGQNCFKIEKGSHLYLRLSVLLLNQKEELSPAQKADYKDRISIEFAVTFFCFDYLAPITFPTFRDRHAYLQVYGL
jgi:hypothetical protein